MSSLRYSAIGLVFSLSAAGLSYAGKGSWLDRYMFERIKITGSRQWGFHMHQVDGDVDAFNSLTFFGQGGRRFTDTGNVNIVGRQVLGLFNFDMTIPDSRFHDPQNQKISLNFSKGGWAVDAGDITASVLNTNQFASLSKHVKGISTMFSSGRFAAKAVHSDTKGSARTVTIQGNNSTGPYYLQSNQIIRDSEQVMVDGQQQYLGTDYVINYEIGSIEFVNRIISPTSSVVVTYEAIDFNGSAGSLSGVGASYDMGKFGKLGVTALEQKSRGGRGLSSRLEQFQGFGAPASPYFLQFEPMNTPAYPTTIRVDGIRQTEGVDYFFDAANKSIFFFRRFIPTTSLVDVTYTPRPTSTANGDRRVIGVDYRIPLNGNGSYIQYSQAVGKLDSDVTPLSGTARGVSGVYNLGGYQFRGSWRDVPDTFVGVESRGFNRNERGVTMSMLYGGKGPLAYGLEYSNNSIGTRQVNNDGDLVFQNARQTTSRAHLAWEKEKQGRLQLEQVRSTAKTASGDSQMDTTSATYSKSFDNGKIETRFGLQYQNGILNTLDNNNAPKRENVSLNTLSIDADWKPGRGFTLGTRASVSGIRTSSQGSSSGRDITLKAGYTPSEKFSIDTAYTDSDSGQLATLANFTSGFGLGYDGNGFSGGAIGTPYVNTGSKVKDFRIYSRYMASKSMTFDAHFYDVTSSGSLYSNTKSTGLGLGLDWNVGGGHNFSMSLDQTNTRFLDSPNVSKTTSLNAIFAGRPKGSPWSYQFGTSVLLSGGNSQFSQDSLYFEGSLLHRINARSNFGFRFQQGRTSGYLPQSDGMAELFYEHQLYQNVSLIGSYKVRNLSNLDFASTAGAYRSRGFDITLSFNFGY